MFVFPVLCAPATNGVHLLFWLAKFVFFALTDVDLRSFLIVSGPIIHTKFANKNESERKRACAQNAKQKIYIATMSVLTIYFVRRDKFLSTFI